MKRLIIILFSCVYALAGQEYKITFFSLPAIDVNMHKENNTINFKAQTVGFIDLIWPATNNYSVTYNQAHFGILAYNKKIRQGSIKYKVSATYNPADSMLTYDNQTLKRIPEVQSIFTILARVQKETAVELDAKWFPMEHDGQLFSTRLLWADTSTVMIGDSAVLCDHYRLDIKAEEDVTSPPEQSDYFMNNIVFPEAVRQLWVEKHGQRRIIQAGVKVYGINIKARISNV
ncbi:MAG TPA: hypothetical protein QGF08_01945 [Candidatus Marinimicrobia bacterium]|mgnify:CR=1 FL=1|nr:hypothetical protein [Candidatus Neomarinimicrobiota bacterium]HJL75501.1 hypothetical protein [Candidatus Neomarinimicrobiota bacterium]HJM69625.1 hypothetical protein [Candidatus Neomarinimicrobiota bacterium]